MWILFIKVTIVDFSNNIVSAVITTIAFFMLTCIITIIVNTESCKYVVTTGVLSHDDYQRSEGVTVLGDDRLQVTTALLVHHLQQGGGHQGVLGVQPQDVGVLDVLFQFVLPL